VPSDGHGDNPVVYGHTVGLAAERNGLDWTQDLRFWVAEIEYIQLSQIEIDAEQPFGRRIIRGDFGPRLIGGSAGPALYRPICFSVIDFESFASTDIGSPIMLGKPIPTIACSNFICFPPGCADVIWPDVKRHYAQPLLAQDHAKIKIELHGKTVSSGELVHTSGRRVGGPSGSRFAIMRFFGTL